MLSLARGQITAIKRVDSRVVEFEVRLLSGEIRSALAYRPLLGAFHEGDEVIVNTEAVDLSLGSGGFDVAVVNLSNLDSDLSASSKAHCMKLNYTPIQHTVELLEESCEETETTLTVPVVIMALHSQLAAIVVGAKQEQPDVRTVYLQTQGGALPGALSETVAALRKDPLLHAHITVSPCFGGQYEAGTLVGGLVAGEHVLNGELLIVGPGPGIQGSSSHFGHGGMQALDSAHAALALGVRPIIAPRASSADSRARHSGLSHHTQTVLRMLLNPVDVACSGKFSDEKVVNDIADIKAETEHRFLSVDTDDALQALKESNLRVESMGRELDDDQDFFRQALAAGVVAGRQAAADGV